MCRKKEGAGLSYVSAHNKVRATRGSASTHQCVDCGATAHHWSYNYESKNEKRDETGVGSAYSEDPADYDPRCVRCHAYFDETAAFYNGTSVPIFAINQFKRDRAAAREQAGPTTFKKVVSNKSSLKKVFTTD